MDEWLLWGDSSQFTKTFAIFNNYLFWIFTWRESNSMRVLTFICGLLFMSMFLVTNSERILNKQLSLTQIIKKKKKNYSFDKPFLVSTYLFQIRQTEVDICKWDHKYI